MAPVGAQTRAPEGARSAHTAVQLSRYGTLVPLATASLLIRAGQGDEVEGAIVGLFTGGLVLGPTLGYLYAGASGVGMEGAGIRTVVLGATAATVVGICAMGDCELGFFGGRWGNALVPSLVVAIVGTGVTAFLAARDIARVGEVVRDRNARSARLRVSPAFFPEARAPGLVVSLGR